MQIRPYQDADLEPLVQLYTASIHTLAAGHYDAAQRAAWGPPAPDLAAWRQCLGGLQTLVAVDRAQLAGFIAYEPDGHIGLLYVSPAHARRGVASALYARAESALLALGASTIFTEASLVAQPFFEHQGLRITAEQQVERGGQMFRRYAMAKSAVSG